MTAKQKGQATLHIINLFDGIEKDITINVVADKVDKPIITYYFNGKNNNETYTQQVNALESFELTKNTFTRAGFTFDGWNTIADGSGTSYSDEDTITSGIDENLRLYAQWTAKKYTLTFDANGGTGTMNDWSNIPIDEGISLMIPTNKYTRTDYKFNGWNTKADGTGISFADRGSMSYEQLTSIDGVVMTLYAQWQKIKSRVTFDANGGTGTMNDLEVNTGSNQTLTLNTFTRTDYRFNGWNTKADGSGTSYSDGQTILVDDDITLYAQWTNTRGKVSFNSNGGTGTMEDQSFTFDTQFKLNKNTFTRAGFTFDGWNTKSDGSGTSYSDEQTITISESVQLYAMWIEDPGYVINNYEVDETNKYINKIMVNTEVNSFTPNIILGYGYEIDVDTKTINNKQLLYTGGKTRITKGLNVYIEYTNIVVGDINGDAAINSADLLKIRQHLLGTNILTGAYFLSSDINYDNTINSADLLRVRQHLLGTKPIE